MLTEAASAHPTATGPQSKKEREYYLDWLRVIAIVLLLFFHCGMAFVAEWGWHIKNAETSEIFQEWMFFLSRWRMALLFFVSGAGTWFVIKRATAGEYIRRRFLRLFIPLGFGMFVIVPPQIYMERIFRGVHFSSYWTFYPTVFEFKPYPQGNTSWHHLWFIAYLFLYSIIGVPLFVWLRSTNGQRFVQSLGKRLTLAVVYSFGIPLALIYAGLIIKFPGPQNLVNDWAMFLFYFVFFVYGYLFTQDPRFARLLELRREATLAAACLCYVALDYFRWNDREPTWGYNVPNMLFLGLRALNSWFWVLAILGYGKAYLNRSTSLLNYANEAIYPFYILHQTVIVILVYYVVQTKDTILTKFLFLSFASFVVTVGLYHFLVRPFNAMRFLFGMKPKGNRD